MIVYNPTDNQISVQIQGHLYEVGPKSHLKDVPEEHAKHWKEQIHSFINIADKEEIVEEVPEVKEEETPELASEEPKEEVVEEKKEEKVKSSKKK